MDLIQRVNYQLGMPKILVLDGVLEFRLRNSILIPALAKMGIKHTLTSEYKPSLNGMSESGVKVSKSLLKKGKLSGECVKIMLFLLSNVPRSHDLSPGELLLGRRPHSIYLELPKQVIVKNAIYHW